MKNTACRYWSLPNSQYIIVDDRDVTIYSNITITALFMNSKERSHYFDYYLKNARTTVFDLNKNQERAVFNKKENFCETTHKKQIPKEVIITRQNLGNDVVLQAAPRRFFNEYPKMQEYINTKWIFDQQKHMSENNIEKLKDSIRQDKWSHHGPIIFTALLIVLVCLFIQLWRLESTEQLYYLRRHIIKLFQLFRLEDENHIATDKKFFDEVQTTSSLL